MRQKPYFLAIFKSHYCKAVFFIALAAGYFLSPRNILNNTLQMGLDALFILLFALVLTCLVRNIKEKIVLAKTYTSSIISIVVAGIGLAALQVCGVGAPVCGATIGIGFISAIFPSFFLGFLTKYGLYILISSILFQALALYFMNCFKQAKILDYQSSGEKK